MLGERQMLFLISAEQGAVAVDIAVAYFAGGLQVHTIWPFGCQHAPKIARV